MATVEVLGDRKLGDLKANEGRFEEFINKEKKRTAMVYLKANEGRFEE